MLTRICTVTILRDGAGYTRSSGVPAEWRVLSRELPQVAELGAARGEGAPMRVSLARWTATDCDPLALDRRLHSAHAPIDLYLQAGSSDDERAAVQVLTRAQIFLPRAASAEDDLGRVLDLHRRLQDLSKPLVAADYLHAHDTHRWVLRLRPNASPALQIAALFHRAFEDAHARAGARMLGQWLGELGLHESLVRRAVDLVADHERPARSAEAQSLSDADALSFFSLNSPGFLDDYGREHTERKVAHTLRRLGPGERWRLSWIKFRADVAEIVRDVAHAEALA